MSHEKEWIDPAKQAPKPEVMNTPGDFGQFTDLMRKIVEKPSVSLQVNLRPQ